MHLGSFINFNSYFSLNNCRTASHKIRQVISQNRPTLSIPQQLPLSQTSSRITTSARVKVESKNIFTISVLVNTRMTWTSKFLLTSSSISICVSEERGSTAITHRNSTFIQKWFVQRIGSSNSDFISRIKPFAASTPVDKQ